MWQKEKGIVLGSVRHNDKSSVLHLFTEGYGHVPYVFYMTSSSKSMARNALLQPLTLIGFDNRIVPSNSLQHLREPVNLRPFTRIPFDPVRGSIALFLGELLVHSLREEGENRPLFNFLTGAVSALDSADDVSNLHLFVMLKLSSYLGFRPNADDYSEGCWLDLKDGVYVTCEPQNGLDPELAYRTIQLLNCGDAPESSAISMTGAQRSSLLGGLNTYYRLHMPSFPVLKSLDVLQEVFG